MEKLMKEAKNSIKLGILSGAGMYGVGKIANIPGMPVQAQNTAGIVGTGLNLANIGQLAKTGMSIIPKEKKLKKLKW